MASPLVHTFTQSGAVGQLIMLTLFAMSILTWGVIAKKIKEARERKRHTDAFLSIFHRHAKDVLSIQAQVQPQSPIAEVFQSGVDHLAEILGSQKSVNEDVEVGAEGGVAIAQQTEFKTDLTQSEVVAVEETLERKITDQLLKLDQFNVILAITAAAGPLLGLLGTVWGIMDSFQSMGTAGNASIAVVAPGISSALVTTVAGLMVAIPALIAFNLINNETKKQAVTMESFASEFISIVKYKYLKTI